MMNMFWRDEEGVIHSAEIVLLGTILVLGMIVGLVELQTAAVAELTDLGDAIGNMDQSYQTSGMASLNYNSYWGVKGVTYGASYNDRADACDCNAIHLCYPGNNRGEKGAFENCAAAGGAAAHHGRVCDPGANAAASHVPHKRQPVPPVPKNVK